MDKEMLSENRRARFDYEIIEKYLTGIELLGPEVKSVKGGHVSLNGSYAIVRNGEVWLLNATIPPYQQNNTLADYDPARTRRLLLHKNEIKELLGKLEQKSITLVPLKLLSSHGLIKVELGLARARKAHDKREVLKKRTAEREMRSTK
ncbi:MAG: SsrA-binding protein SmpB [Candidatus Liptonbacteria bacterium]